MLATLSTVAGCVLALLGLTWTVQKDRKDDQDKRETALHKKYEDGRRDERALADVQLRDAYEDRDVARAEVAQLKQQVFELMKDNR
jgi:hypothetical protein